MGWNAVMNLSKCNTREDQLLSPMYAYYLEDLFTDVILTSDVTSVKAVFFFLPVGKVGYLEYLNKYK